MASWELLARGECTRPVWFVLWWAGAAQLRSSSNSSRNHTFPARSLLYTMTHAYPCLEPFRRSRPRLVSVWAPVLRIRDVYPRSRIPDPDFNPSWITDHGSRISDLGSRIPDLGPRIPDPESRIPDLKTATKESDEQKCVCQTRILKKPIPDTGSRIQDPGTGSRIRIRNTAEHCVSR